MKKSKSIFTVAQLKQSPIWEKNKHLFELIKNPGKPVKVGGSIVSKIYIQKSKEKMAIESALLDFCTANGIILYSEYRFHEERKWRLDWYFEYKGKRIGIEYEGIVSEKSRHTGIKGYSGDTDKYRAASLLGIDVMRYTALNYGELEVDLGRIVF